MSFITAYSLVLAEVVLCSLHNLVLVKKDSPSISVSDSCQVFSSTVPVTSVTGYARALQAILILLIA